MRFVRKLRRLLQRIREAPCRGTITCLRCGQPIVDVTLRVRDGTVWAEGIGARCVRVEWVSPDQIGFTHVDLDLCRLPEQPEQSQ